MNAPPLPMDYISSLPTLNDVIRRSLDTTVVAPNNGLLVSDFNGSGHTCRIGAIYDAGTGGWVIIAIPVS